MQPNAGPYHSGYNFTPRFSPRPTSFASHAAQYHAQGVMRTFIPPAQQPQPMGPAAAPTQTATPLNNYIPNATIKTTYEHKTVDTHTKLRPGDVVEVNRPGHQTELAYANSNGILRPLNETTINHLPPELRTYVNRVGGPSYFAHEIHNRLPTAGLAGQFNAQNFHGPNRPLI